MKITWQKSERAGQRGFSFIGLLIVVIIILVLTGWYFGGDSGGGLGGYMDRTEQAAGVYQSATGRARDVRDGQDIRAFQQQIEMWMINHPNQTPTIDVLERDPTFNVPRPPEGYRWEINESNEPVLIEKDISHVRGVPVSPNMP